MFIMKHVEILKLILILVKQHFINNPAISKKITRGINNITIVEQTTV